MDYAHSYNPNIDGLLYPQNWARIVMATAKVFGFFNHVLPQIVTNLPGLDDPPDQAVICVDAGSLRTSECDPFRLYRNGGGSVCRTQGEAYDEVVVAVLCIVNYYVPGWREIRSSGETLEWQEGRRRAASALGVALTAVPFPLNIEGGPAKRTAASFQGEVNWF
jgi:hypothetical protein